MRIQDKTRLSNTGFTGVFAKSEHDEKKLTRFEKMRKCLLPGFFCRIMRGKRWESLLEVLTQLYIQF